MKRKAAALALALRRKELGSRSGGGIGGGSGGGSDGDGGGFDGGVTSSRQDFHPKRLQQERARIQEAHRRKW